MSEEKDTTPSEFTLESAPPSREEERKAKDRTYSMEYYHANRKIVLAKLKADREANPGKYAAKDKAYREADPEKYSARDKAWREANPEKRATRNKAWREANKARVKAGKLRRKYGLTAEAYFAMVASCNGRCPCCKAPFSMIIGQQPCVDHDHKQGRVREAVRGIICHRCNLVLGHADDEPKILRACARYLDRIKAQSGQTSFIEPGKGRKGGAK
jgi:hypothetical protein